MSFWVEFPENKLIAFYTTSCLQANQAKHDQHDNSWSSQASAAADKQGAHQGHVAGHKDSGDSFDHYLKHQEVHKTENEDFDHKNVLHEVNKKNNFQQVSSFTYIFRGRRLCGRRAHDAQLWSWVQSQMAILEA